MFPWTTSKKSDAAGAGSQWDAVMKWRRFLHRQWSNCVWECRRHSTKRWTCLVGCCQHYHRHRWHYVSWHTSMYTRQRSWVSIMGIDVYVSSEDRWIALTADQWCYRITRPSINTGLVKSNSCHLTSNHDAENPFCICILWDIMEIIIPRQNLYPEIQDGILEMKLVRRTATVCQNNYCDTCFLANLTLHNQFLTSVLRFEDF